MFNTYLVVPLFLVLLSIGCSESGSSEMMIGVTTDKIDTFFLNGSKKTVLLLKEDGEFDYVCMDYRDDPMVLFFRTKGLWHKFLDTLYFTSINDSLISDSAKVVSLTPIDSSYSEFRFYDVYGDSIGFMYVTYPDGLDYNQGSDMGDRNFDWTSDSRQTLSLEFHFVHYKSWKYFSDGKNYKHSIFLRPMYTQQYFKDEKFLLKGDTLINVLNPSRYVFIRSDIGKIISSNQ